MGQFYLTLIIFVGFILLIPLSTFLEALIEHIGLVNRGMYLLLANNSIDSIYLHYGTHFILF